MILSVVLTAAVVLPVANAAGGPTIETKTLRLTLRGDLNGPASLVDLRTGRDYVAPEEPPAGLYRLNLGRNPAKPVRVLTSLDAVRRQVRTAPDGSFEIAYEHDGEFPLTVLCSASSGPKGDAIGWRIRVQGIVKEPLAAIEFPVLSCTDKLGPAVDDDAIVYPHMEGVLLTRPGVSIRKGGTVGDTYPGTLSAQFMYYFDAGGGVYVAAKDAAGQSKALVVQRQGKALTLAVRHLFPSELSPAAEVPYEVVWSAAGGRWEDGAGLYRDWAERQPWCSRKVEEADVPAWLKQPVVFVNFSVRGSANGPYATATAADKSLLKYREFFGAPVVGCAFGWERNGAWIGPEYFPPYPDEPYYRELARRLKERGDHLHVFTSGFRWGVRKPMTENKAKTKPRVYTDYDSRARFEQEGKTGAVVRADGELDFTQPPWADNYSLCAAAESARKVLLDAFQRIHGWGVDGVDLDQNIGAGVSPCWNTKHGHPAGCGRWQFDAVSSFLREAHTKGRKLNPDAFIGVEEPCEAFIPWIDLYHGRAFTDTRWPATGPGAVSVPLYVYLYHERQPGYAGWIDAGFSPAGNVRVGICRAFLFGMQPGVRINGRPFDLLAGPPTEEMKLCRRTFTLFKRMRPYLLLGRMLPAPTVTGAPLTRVPGKLVAEAPAASAARATKGSLPVPWPVVQATAWSASAGTVCYAVANLCGGSQTVQLRAEANGMTARRVRLTHISPDGELILEPAATCPAELRLALAPWEVLCIEQTPAGNGL